MKTESSCSCPEFTNKWLRCGAQKEQWETIKDKCTCSKVFRRLPDHHRESTVRVAADFLFIFVFETESLYLVSVFFSIILNCFINFL